MAFLYKVKKGDTLNKIAQQFGFKNYKEAGITSVPSGNFDLIRPDEEIYIGNYDPNKLRTFEEGSPVISSKDDEQGFKENGSQLDKMLEGLTAFQESKEQNAQKQNTGEVIVNDEGKVRIDNENVSKIDLALQKQKQEFEMRAQERKNEIMEMYNTSLAMIDSTVKATIDRINVLYDQRIKEQTRINNLNIDRVKAYGLAHGGQYTPISFNDSISEREEEAASKISELERQRIALIAEAEMAREKGKSGLLKEKMEAIQNINETLQKNLRDAEKEAEEQLKLSRELAKEEEAKRKAEVEDMKRAIALIAPKIVSELEKLDEEEQENYIEKLAKETRVDYASVYGIINSARSEIKLGNLKIQKEQADIDATKALEASRKASAEASLALAEEKRKKIAQLKGNMSDFTTSQLQKLEQKGLLNASREQQLDYLFGDEVDYEIKWGDTGGTTNTGKAQRWKSPNGDIYEFETLTPEEIEELRKAGYTKQ